MLIPIAGNWVNGWWGKQKSFLTQADLLNPDHFRKAILVNDFQPEKIVSDRQCQFLEIDRQRFARSSQIRT